MIAAHWLDEPRAEAFAFGTLGAVPKSSVVAYGMEYVVHA
jgi:hypothetical protein